jgi:hypothetical protein
MLESPKKLEALMDPHQAGDTSLAAAIGGAGRRMSPRSLALIILGAAVALIAILWLWHGHRMLAVPLVMPVAFGVWGLAEHGERALEAEGAGPNVKVELVLLHVLRVTMVIVGAAAAAASMFAATFAIAGQGGYQMR